MFNDLRYAIRTLLRAPAFAAVAILTLAVGIGANTAIFSVVNGVLLRPLPYPNAAAIVEVWSSTAEEPHSGYAAADFLDLQRDNRTLAVLAGYREDAITIAPPGGEPDREIAAIVTADYFDVFGTGAALGRPFSRAADGGTNEPLAVLSYDTWQHMLQADSQAPGRRVRINGVPHTIVGVMPASFDYPEGAKAWILSPKAVPTPPLDVEGDLLQTRDVHYFRAVALLKPGVSADAATADLAGIAADLGRRYPETNGGRTVQLESLHERIVGDVRQALLLLLSAVGVVLLIACANVASLLLARASGRQRELAVRAALGAARLRLVRQLVTESLILGGAGGIAGLFAGTWAVAFLVKILPDGIPRADQIGLDLRVAAVAVLVSLLSALIFGLLPAIQASRPDASLVLRDSGDRGSTAGVRRARTRAALVVAEIALTLVLLVSAGLLMNSFIRLERLDPGFRVNDLTVVMLPLPQAQYTDGKKQAAFYQRVLDGVRQRPGITSAAVLFPTPLEGNNANASFTIEGRPATTSRADRPHASLSSISTDYFRTMGIALVKGRDFTAQDREPAPAVVIVNQALAGKYWKGEDAIGKRIRFGEKDEDWMRVVGVVADARNVGLELEPAPLLYLPYPYFTLPFMSVVARSSTGPGAVATAVREEVHAIDPGMPIDTVKPMTTLLAEQIAEPRFRTTLIGAFALMAMLLAAVGVYGLISYSVALRTREMGIRIALGATPRQVMLPVLKEGLLLAAAGIALGIGGALFATRLLAGFLFGVGTSDPLTFAAVASMLLAVALLASYVPSRRALRIDPIVALKES